MQNYCAGSHSWRKSSRCKRSLRIRLFLLVLSISALLSALITTLLTVGITVLLLLLIPLCTANPDSSRTITSNVS